MNKDHLFPLICLAGGLVCLLTVFIAAAFHLGDPRPTHFVTHQRPPREDKDVSVTVKPKQNYSATVHRGERLALVLDARNGRLWKIESRPDAIADEYPEGKAEVEYTTIYFTPKEVNGEGDVVLKTKISENYPEDWSKADTSKVHLLVRNANN